MREKSIAAAAAALLCAILAVSAEDQARFASSGPIKIVTGEFEPWSGEGLKDGGMATAIVREALKRMGMSPEFAFLPWSRGYEECLHGTYAATFPYSRNVEREKSFIYSQPLYRFQVPIFVRANSTLTFDKPEDLVGMTLCMPVGWNLFNLKDLIAAGKIKLETSADLAGAFKMLAAGRADFIPVQATVGWKAVDEALGTRSGIKTLPKPLLNAEDYLIVPRNLKGAEDLVARFNAALEKLRSSGFVDAVVAGR